MLDQEQLDPQSIIRLENLVEEYFMQKSTGASPAEAILTAINLIYIRQNCTRLHITKPAARSASELDKNDQLIMDVQQTNHAYGLIGIILQHTNANNLMIFFRYLQAHFAQQKLSSAPNDMSCRPNGKLRHRLKSEIILLRQERLISSE